MPRLRRYFLVGLVITAPVGFTVIVLRWVFDRLDAIFGRPIQLAVGFRIPGLGFVLLGLVILVVGWVVHHAVGLRLLKIWNEALVRFPIAGRLYNAASQIVQSLAGEQSRVFRRTVLVPFPTEGMWSLGFVTDEDAPVMTQLLGQPCLHVFVPTTPNPTSGLLMVVPRTRVVETDISIEDGMKFVISAGALSPTSGATRSPRRGLDLESLFRDRSR